MKEIKIDNEVFVVDEYEDFDKETIDELSNNRGEDDD